MGLCGSLMASTWRSNQSFTAWLLAQTKGPVKISPKQINNQWSDRLWPEATAPQANAHTGGNQVIGLSSSATVLKRGRISGFVSSRLWVSMRPL
jgi:hypothetical protein